MNEFLRLFLFMLIAFPTAIFAQNAGLEFVSIEIQNNAGDINIIGEERNSVEITAINPNSQKPVAVSRTEKNSSKGKILVITVSGNPAETSLINLDVKVPRKVKIEPINLKTGSITVSNLESTLNLKTSAGNINLTNIGGAILETASGDITAELVKGDFKIEADLNQDNRKSSKINLKNIGGNTEIITGDGIITAQNIGGEVRLTSLHSRKISFQCVKGRVEINDTHSIISLRAIEGDLELTTTTGEAHFTGEVRAGKRYRMKTLTGVVSMSIPENSGFTALLKTYSGELKSAYLLENDNLHSTAKPTKQLSGKYGNGQARIELDSFSGATRLRKIETAEIIKCEP